MCRLFGSTEARGVARTLLRGEFTKLSHANPQGHGIAFVRDGELAIDKRVGPAFANHRFALQPEIGTSGTVLAHARFAFGSKPDIRNTHPWLIDADRAFAHNGAIQDVAAMRNELGSDAAFLQGASDSEAWGRVVGRFTKLEGGDFEAGTARAVEWLATHSATAGAYFVSTTKQELAALSWPWSGQMFYATGKHAGGVAQGREGYTLVASQPLDTSHAWKEVAPGHLLTARGDDVRLTKVTDRTESAVPWRV